MRHTAMSRPILVKRYAQSRLYDTTGLRYISVDTLRAWSLAGIAFTVIDAETGEDVRSVLLA